MIKFETWVALGSLALAVLFVLLVLSFYNFLIGPKGTGPQTVDVDPNGVMILNVSIAGVPSLILAGLVYGLAGSSTGRNTAFILLSSGVILIIGMFAARFLYTKISPTFVVTSVILVPNFFIIAGLGVLALGGYLLFISRSADQNLERETK
jgi:hypothetical protein